MGTLQMLAGATAMAVVGRFSDGTPLPMVIGMTAGPLLALLLTWGTLGGQGKRPGAESVTLLKR